MLIQNKIFSKISFRRFGHVKPVELDDSIRRILKVHIGLRAIASKKGRVVLHHATLHGHTLRIGRIEKNNGMGSGAFNTMLPYMNVHIYSGEESVQLVG
jgi:hypothetical protein